MDAPRESNTSQSSLANAKIVENRYKSLLYMYIYCTKDQGFKILHGKLFNAILKLNLGNNLHYILIDLLSSIKCNNSFLKA